MQTKTVLITGATGGIGFALAKKFAQEGYRLILVSSCQKHLADAQAKLLPFTRQKPIYSICQDLSRKNAAEAVYQKTARHGITIDILVNNAGFGIVGEAGSADPQKEEAMLWLQIQTTTRLCELFLKDMYQRGNGKILNVSSVGAFQPGPYTAAYYASKAYIASYSRAIRFEAASGGVSVCTLYPGTTRTGFFEKAGSKTPFWAMSPDRVAKIAYSGLMKNQEVIIPGILNRTMRLIPANLKVKGIALLKKRTKK